MYTNLLTVNGSIGQPKFWRYWLLCNLANALTVAMLVITAVLAFRWAWGA